MHKLIIGATAAVAVVAGSLVMAAAANADTGTVVRVVDGDTLVVSINNIDQTIRLLNVNAPETKDPNRPVECLGSQANDFLKEALPKGSKVRLEFDRERHDRYGRTLAGVFNSSGALINAEVARRGFGIPVVIGDNRKFLPPVQAAYEEARGAASGLFSESVDCTLPAQLAIASDALDTAETVAPATTSGAAAANAAALAAALLTAKAARELLSAARDTENTIVWAAFSAEEAASKLSSLTARIAHGDARLTKLKEQEKTLAAAEKKVAEERKAAATRAAAAKKAVAEKKAAEEKAKAAAAAEAERIRNLPVPAPYVPPAPAPYVPPAPAPYVPPAPVPYVPPAPVVPADPYPGYTGPRCYAPGGKTWRPC